MLKKISVALLGATMLSAPVLAQGPSGHTKITPPVAAPSSKNATQPTTPAVAANKNAAQPAKPAVKAEVKKPKKHVRSHRRGGMHAKAVKNGKYLKAATGTSVKAKKPGKSMRHVKRGTRHVARGNATKPTSTR